MWLQSNQPHPATQGAKIIQNLYIEVIAAVVALIMKKGGMLQNHLVEEQVEEAVRKVVVVTVDKAFILRIEVVRGEIKFHFHLRHNKLTLVALLSRPE